jgi:hypothetical protein
MTTTIAPTPTPDDVAGLDEADIAALKLALQQTLNGDDVGRVEQVLWKLDHDGWWDTARFCTYDRQMDMLNLRPWQRPPCWMDLEEANEILSDRNTTHHECARLYKRMVRLGVSPYHPDPVTAIAEAQKAKRQRKGLQVGP